MALKQGYEDPLMKLVNQQQSGEQRSYIPKTPSPYGLNRQASTTAPAAPQAPVAQAPASSTDYNYQYYQPSTIPAIGEYVPEKRAEIPKAVRPSAPAGYTPKLLNVQQSMGADATKWGNWNSNYYAVGPGLFMDASTGQVYKPTKQSTGPNPDNYIYLKQAASDQEVRGALGANYDKLNQFKNYAFWKEPPAPSDEEQSKQDILAQQAWMGKTINSRLDTLNKGIYQTTGETSQAMDNYFKSLLDKSGYAAQVASQAMLENQANTGMLRSGQTLIKQDIIGTKGMLTGNQIEEQRQAGQYGLEEQTYKATQSVADMRRELEQKLSQAELAGLNEAEYKKELNDIQQKWGLYIQNMETDYKSKMALYNLINSVGQVAGVGAGYYLSGMGQNQPSGQNTIAPGNYGSFWGTLNNASNYSQLGSQNVGGYNSTPSNIA
jgi:hypothetical protein